VLHNDIFPVATMIGGIGAEGSVQWWGSEVMGGRGGKNVLSWTGREHKTFAGRKANNRHKEVNHLASFMLACAGGADQNEKKLEPKNRQGEE